MPAERPALRRRLVAAALALLPLAGVAQQPPRPPAAPWRCAPPATARAAMHRSSSFRRSPASRRIFIENQLVLIREGLREVPAMQAVMKDIDDAAITALATHFAAQPVRSRAPQALDAAPCRARRRAVAAAPLCGTCHLADYAGQQQVPRLSGQSEAYLLQSMQQFRDHPGPGRDTIMAATLLGLSDRDLSDLAHYLASRKP